MNTEYIYAEGDWGSSVPIEVKQVTENKITLESDRYESPVTIPKKQVKKMLMLMQMESIV